MECVRERGLHEKMFVLHGITPMALLVWQNIYGKTFPAWMSLQVFIDRLGLELKRVNRPMEASPSPLKQ